MIRISNFLSTSLDHSPYLVHLTKDTEFNGQTKSASDNLWNILQGKCLNPGNCLSDALLGLESNRQTDLDLLNAICFTESPISELDLLLKMPYINAQLSEYGLVFRKESLRSQNTSPVLSLGGNEEESKILIRMLCQIESEEAKRRLLPLISRSRSVNFDSGWGGGLAQELNFLLEREWRRPRTYGPLTFNEKNVFIGLCPEEKIPFFEKSFSWLKFIDPRKSLKESIGKIIEIDQQAELSLT